MAVQMVYTRFQNKEETIKNTCLVSSISIFRGGGGGYQLHMIPVTAILVYISIPENTLT